MVLLSEEDREFVEDFIDGKERLMIFVVFRQDTREFRGSPVSEQPEMIKAFVIRDHAEDYIRTFTDEDVIEEGEYYTGKDDDDADYFYEQCKFEY